MECCNDWYGVQSIWSALYCLVWSSEHMECCILTGMEFRAYGVLYTYWYGVQSIRSAVY